MEKLKIYLKFFRIGEWRAYFLMAFLGFGIARGFNSSWVDIAIFFALIVLFLAFGFAINNCFDTKEDQYHKDQLNPLAQKKMRFKTSFFISLFPGILGLALSIFFGKVVFLFCLAGLTVSFFYSAPPLRFKERPVFDLISHGFFAGAFWFILPLLVFRAEWSWFHYLISLSIFYLSLTLELRNHLEDFVSDKEAGTKTFVCVFGRNFSDKLLRVLVLFFPATLLPIFLFDFPRYLFLFLFLTLIFIFFFQLFHRLKLKMTTNYKVYRVMDIYSVSLFSLLAFLKIA